MAKLPSVPSYSSTLFSTDPGWPNGSIRMVSEASLIRWGRLYDDAMDVGFEIVSKKTGKSELFYHESTTYNKDREASAFVFYPVNPKLHNRVYVVLFNT